MVLMLDAFSVAYMGMIASTLMAAAMILNWQVQKQQPGMALWALAYISGAFGLVLIGLRSSLTYVVSIALANVFLDGFICFIWIGMRRFVGKAQGGWCVSAMLIAAHLCFNLHNIIVAPDVDARIVSASVFHAVFSILCLFEMVRCPLCIRKYSVYIVIMAFFAMHLVFNMLRAVAALEGGPIDRRFAMLEGIVMGIALSFCFIIISNQVLRKTLEGKNKHIIETKNKLREAIYLYRDMTSRIPGGVYTLRLDRDGNRKFEFLNKAMSEIFDIQKEEAFFNPNIIYDSIHPEDRPGLDEVDRLAGQNLQPFRWEGRIIIRGEIRWIRVQSNALKVSEEESLWNGIAIDITDEILQKYALIKQASIDELTGLLSRRQFLEMGDLFFQKSIMSDDTFVVAMIDIDHFKKINDSHGHSAGDHVLEEFGRLARSHFSPQDILGRLGGEEFGIVLSGASCSEAISAVQKFRTAIEGLTVNWQNRTIYFTISCGLCMYSCSINTFQQILNNADDALYKAKERGRNQIVVYS